MRHRSIQAFIVLSVGSLFAPGPAVGQNLIITIKLDPDQIGVIRTAQGLTTRLAFAEPVREIICGDLYDPASGKGSFVVQRSDNDVFIKPITTRGASNLFVRTGDKVRRVYNFDLSIVTFDKAYRVVNVESAQSPQSTAGGGDPAGADSARLKDDSLKEAHDQAEEILRTARQQASRIVAEARQSVDETERQAKADAPQQVERRFITALLDGLNTTRTNNPHVATQKKVTLRLDKDIFTFEGRSYIRYTIQNSGSQHFVYDGLLLEATSSGTGRKPIQTDVIQSKQENRVAPGETLAGILVFDQKVVGIKDKLVLSLKDRVDGSMTHTVVFE